MIIIYPNMILQLYQWFNCHEQFLNIARCIRTIKCELFSDISWNSCVLKYVSTRAPMLIVDRMPTIPILLGRFQSASIINISFPLINQSHDYFTAQIQPSFLHRPVLLSHNSSNALFVQQSVPTGQTKPFPRHVMKDENSEKCYDWTLK